jgi:hypothetical protein
VQRSAADARGLGAERVDALSIDGICAGGSGEHQTGEDRDRPQRRVHR